MIQIEVLNSPATDEAYASVGDLLLLLKDAKESPLKKYNEKILTQICEEVLGKRAPGKEMERPF